MILENKVESLFTPFKDFHLDSLVLEIPVNHCSILVSTNVSRSYAPGMTCVHASPYAKLHRYGWHTRDALLRCHQFWWYMVFRDPACGLPLQRGSKSLAYGLPLCLVCRPGGRGGGVGCMGFGSWVSPDRMSFAGPRHSVSITPGRRRRVQPWT